MEEELRRWRSADKVYQEQMRIDYDMLDCNGHIKARDLLNLFSIVASNDFTELGLSYRTMRDKGFYFVITRASARVIRDPLDNELLTLRTWPYKVKGMQVERGYELVDQTGEVVVAGRELFVIIDASNAHPIRIADFPLLDWYVVDHNPACGDCERIRLAECSEHLAFVRATFCDLDANRHVNNANYPRYVYDNLPEDMQNRRWHDLMVGFDSETKVGENLDLLLTADDGDYYGGEWVKVVARKGDGRPSFGCAFRFDE